MSSRVRSAAFSGYIPTAESVGLDPYEMLRRVGLSPQLLEVPEHPIPLAALDSLLEQSARQSGREGFGLMMSEARTLGSLGPLAVLLAQETSCREVIEHLIRFQRLLTDAVTYSLESDGDLHIFRTELTGNTVGRQVLEYMMGTTCRVLRDGLRLPWAPESAHFVHAAPRDLRIHARVFQCELQFQSPFNGFACTPEALDAEREGGDPELADQALQMMALLLARKGDDSVEGRARRTIQLLLPSGTATLEQVAWAMDISPRKLQRVLDERAQTFRQLLNEVRCDLASRYLSSPDHTIAAISQMTGFATPTAFTRWFRDQFGEAPSIWRFNIIDRGENSCPVGVQEIRDESPSEPELWQQVISPSPVATRMGDANVE